MGNFKPLLLRILTPIFTTTITGANPAPVWLTDVQELINEVNEDNADAAAEADVVKAVVDATNQIQLLKALQDNGFERVNADWIADYATETVGGQSGMLALSGPTNYFGVVSTGVDKADIRDAIDAANGNAISAADTAADTAAKQAAVTALIQKWVADDVAPATAKADAIEASKIKEAVFKVQAAKTANSLYTALVGLANLDSANLAPAALNANLKADYLVAQKAHTFTAVTTAEVATSGGYSSTYSS